MNYNDVLTEVVNVEAWTIIVTAVAGMTRITSEAKSLALIHKYINVCKYTYVICTYVLSICG